MSDSKENILQILKTQDVFNLLVQHLDSRSPFALTRCGDGEAMLLEGNIDKMRPILKKYLGYEYNNEEILQIRENLIVAFNDSDVIGAHHWAIKYKNNPKYYYWIHTIKILQFNCSIGSQLICDTDIHYNLLQEGYYEKLLQNLDFLFYISCWNLDNELKKRYNIKEINSFIVPPELFYNPSYVGPKHFPEQFERAIQWIRQCSCTGKLCLVGAGLMGKSYVIEFKNRGGVAIDVGSVFDRWAGRVTRGPGSSPMARDSKYKI